MFNEVLRRCMDAGLIKGEGFAVDVSVTKVDAKSVTWRTRQRRGQLERSIVGSRTA
jgi:hypothetical protein